MTSEQFPNDSTPGASTRTLKIEEHGGFSKDRVKPKIRLIGRWLEKAGFIPGDHVHVLCMSPGVIELRSSATLHFTEAKPIKLEQPDLALD